MEFRHARDFAVHVGRTELSRNGRFTCPTRSSVLYLGHAQLKVSIQGREVDVQQLKVGGV